MGRLPAVSLWTGGASCSISAAVNPAVRRATVWPNTCRNWAGVAVMSTASIRTVHRACPWLIRAYGRWCFCPVSAMDTSHGPSGGSASRATTSRMSLRAVSSRSLLPQPGDLGWEGPKPRPGAAATVHMRMVSGGLPEHTQVQA